ncbi:MAG TPA: rod shape-determining protein RodA [Streptosporangiaceae bacterium]|nr:rod shape-determining protein RodA [Streptosporangiaceae bacterium]
MSWVSGQARRRSRTGPAWAAVRRIGARAVGRRSALRQSDWLLLFAVLALSLLGTLMIWSATQPMLVQQGANPHGFLLKQLLNIALGMILMLTVSAMDSRQIRLYAPILYGVSCVGLLAVLTPLGSIVNGARSWISLGAGFQVEPSEFAKLSVIVIAAMLLSRLRSGQTRPGAKAVGLTLGISAVPILLVVAEPDLGVVIVLVLLVIGLIALSGVRLRWLAGLAVTATVAVVAVAKLHLLKAYQVSRLTSFLNPSADPRGTGYSAAQAKIAIGSGGMHGTGLFHSQLIAGSFVPEQHTDFIFAVVGNELGFVGSLLVIGLLGLLLFCALRISAKAEDQFGTLIAAGIAIWFAVQSFVNIGMTVGIMPVTGLPLPFVSYGGSAMFADMVAVGLLQSVRRRRSVFAS